MCAPYAAKKFCSELYLCLEVYFAMGCGTFDYLLLKQAVIVWENLIYTTAIREKNKFWVIHI